jgi:hypothetical protein
MPKGSKVHKLAGKLEAKGLPKGESIAIAQKQTGQSYATGKAPKSKSGKK